MEGEGEERRREGRSIDRTGRAMAGEMHIAYRETGVRAWPHLQGTCVAERWALRAAPLGHGRRGDGGCGNWQQNDFTVVS